MRWREGGGEGEGGKVEGELERVRGVERVRGGKVEGELERVRGVERVRGC